MKSISFYIALLLGCSHGIAQAEVFEKTLSNGLKVIVKEDHRAPVIVQQIWYKAGSMDERTGTTGVAHVLEHMMFKGTRSVPAGGVSTRICAGGEPQSLLFESLMAAAYQEHPYQHPVIGWMNDLQTLTAADARAWYKTWYGPNNAGLVVAGGG